MVGAEEWMRRGWHFRLRDGRAPMLWSAAAFAEYALRDYDPAEDERIWDDWQLDGFRVDGLPVASLRVQQATGCPLRSRRYANGEQRFDDEAEKAQRRIWAAEDAAEAAAQWSFFIDGAAWQRSLLQPWEVDADGEPIVTAGGGGPETARGETAAAG